MRRTLTRPTVAGALAAAALALAASPAAAAPASVTGRQCVDGGGVIYGDDPFPPAWCSGGIYNGQQISDAR
ncbi:hypothetical protein [Actinomadura gamaensis]|uniref:Uncharacterized protein n=1 Tax=Actinomadura gamaensis TaxID=1763541 RepID=A0ABV9U578_9ACTN